jgi:Ca-activated chloride channel homolog
MHLRNNPLLTLAISLLSLSLGTAAQNPPNPPPSNPPPPTQTQPAEQPSTGAGQQAAHPQSAPPPQPSQAPGQGQPAVQGPVQSPDQNQATPSGQEPATEGGGFTFKAEAREVQLHATVIDDKQHLITNLDKNAFTVFEDGKPQTITSFRHEDIPVALGIVIDNSGSMREKRDRVNKATLNLVRASNAQDQVFIVNFNDEYYLDQDYTSDVNKLREALEKVEARGGTALYDALVASADHLKKSARLQKKALLVVTDGEDNASRESLEQAVRRLQEENGPTVYAIGILGDEKQRRARRALQTLAERTGGIAFLPRTADEVDEISRTVAHDIRNQYTIGYRPSTPTNTGGYRTIHVDARARGYNKLTVRTRSGYYAGQEQSAGGGN